MPSTLKAVSIREKYFYRIRNSVHGKACRFRKDCQGLSYPGHPRLWRRSSMHEVWDLPPNMPNLSYRRDRDAVSHGVAWP